MPWGGPLGSDPAGYANVIRDTIYWGGAREKEFKQCMGKSLPMITCYPGMGPRFFQEGEVHSIALPPIVPTIQPARPIPAPIAPKSETSEGSKKNHNKYAVVGITAVSLAVCMGIAFYLVKKYL